MLDACLTRYQREAKGGFRCTLQKQERVKGEPKPPAQPPVEVDRPVRPRRRAGPGDEADRDRGADEVEVRGKKALGAGRVRRARCSARSPTPDTEREGRDVAARRLVRELSARWSRTPTLAQGQSRYCIRDAGLYRTMLRTHEAWKARKDGRRAEDRVPRQADAGTQRPRVPRRQARLPAGRGGRVRDRRDRQPDPKVVAAEGFTEVTIFIDAERWLQVGTELYRTEPDGTRVLVGAYYFRDVQLNPESRPARSPSRA